MTNINDITYLIVRNTLPKTLIKEIDKQVKIIPIKDILSVIRKLTMLAYHGIEVIENKNSSRKESLMGLMSVQNSDMRSTTTLSAPLLSLMVRSNS